jgi:hypothetical protein
MPIDLTLWMLGPRNEKKKDTSMKIEMGKKYKMRNGTPVEIVGIDFHGEHNVAGWFFDHEGRRRLESWTNNGSVYYRATEPNPRDLVEAYDIPEGFIEWHGGECPVDENASVEVVLRHIRGDAVKGKARSWNWSSGDDGHGIIAYRVVKQKLRPFTKDEFFPFRDSWFVYKDGNDNGAYPCQRCDDDCVTINSYRHSWEQVLNYFRFSDGRPCGVLEND